MGMNKEKIKVVYNGIDCQSFSKQKEKKEKYGFSSSDYLIGILGRISEEKGHFLAVKAIERLSSKYPGAYLLISGKGRLELKLRAYINKSCFKEKIKFLNCPADNFLGVIDLLLVPSNKEGFGYSIIEAFSKEVPVIGYNIGGISEIIKDKRNGLLFYNYDSLSLAEAVEAIILGQALRKKIIDNAKKDVLFFSIERMAAGVEEVYQEALGARKAKIERCFR